MQAEGRMSRQERGLARGWGLARGRGLGWGRVQVWVSQWAGLRRGDGLGLEDCVLRGGTPSQVGTQGVAG